jgi:ATP adenylyltransferase
MKTLWTPWRVEHVRGLVEKPAHCIFEPPTSAGHSRDDLLLYQDDQVVVLLNRFPYANGHLLVAPRRHLRSISMLSDTENQRLMKIMGCATTILNKQLNPDGFNIGCNIGATAGAGIADHLHFHVVPRWQGDHNFITVVAEIRTIPEHIQATFDTLLPDFQKLQTNQTCSP